MNSLAVLNTAVIALLLAGVTLGGHLLSVKAKTSRGFFTAEGGLPWWAVSASLYATVVSAASFVSIPAAVFRPGGNLTLIQLLFGLSIGKLIMAFMFARPYFESRSVETVYDYLTARIGSAVSKSTMGLQILLLLAQTSVVILSAALVLNVLTDISLPVSCIIIVGFAVLWSWMGGLSTVVWTDAMLFGIFVIGALVSVWLTFSSSNVGVTEAIRVLDGNAKLKIIDISTDPSKAFTLWTGLLAGALTAMIPVSSQSGMQRIRACRSVWDAQKAIIFSVVFFITPILLLTVGLGLSLFYSIYDIPTELADRIRTQPDQVFPYFMLNEIPDGVSGLFIAAVFAAAISTLDSRLAELADVSVTNVYRPYIRPDDTESHYLKVARLLIIAWGLLFCVTSVSLSYVDGQNMFDLSLMATNTFGGPILGIFFLARYNLGNTWSVALGVCLCVAVTTIFQSLGVTHYWWLPVSVTIMMLSGWIVSGGKLDSDGIVHAPADAEQDSN